jgi:hypothetical protein
MEKKEKEIQVSYLQKNLLPLTFDESFIIQQTDGGPAPQKNELIHT